MTLIDEDDLRDQLEDLRRKHREMDEQIELLMQAKPVDFMTIARLKKEKLAIKDTINRIESSLIPDIIA